VNVAILSVLQAQQQAQRGKKSVHTHERM
jgi:hypothetical protein